MMLRFPTTLLTALWLANTTLHIANAQPCNQPFFTQRQPANETVSWPRNMRSVNATYDSTYGVVVVIGEAQFGMTRELQVWEWDGRVWDRKEPLDGSAPPPLFEPAVAYDPDTGRVLVFGGMLQSGDINSQMYLWDGAYWGVPPLWSVSPQGVYGAALVHDPFKSEMVLFGGIGVNGESRQVATWTSAGWTVYSPNSEHQPWPLLGRTRNNTSFWESNQKTFFFEPRGISQVGTSAGVWAWSSPIWIQSSQSQPPGAQVGFDIVTAQDPMLNAIVRIVTDGPDSNSQIWQWDGELWPFHGFANPTMPRRVYGVSSASDTRRDVVVVVGYESASTTGPLGVWEFEALSGVPRVSDVTVQYGVSSFAYVEVSGAGPLTFQWYLNGVALEDGVAFEGTQDSAMAINTREARCYEGALACRVTGPCGSVQSADSILSIGFVADFNMDGGVTGDDVAAFFTAFAAGEPFADVGCDGGVEGSDVEAFFLCWESACDA